MAAFKNEVDIFHECLRYMSGERAQKLLSVITKYDIH